MNANAQELLPDTAVDSTPAGLLRMAVQKGTDADQLTKLMDLYDRWNADQSRRAYAESMRAVQSEAPTIERASINSQTNSKYAKLEAVNAGPVPVYTQHGFSLSFAEGKAEKDGHIRTECDVSHNAGHTERKGLELPIDDVGIKGVTNKTPIHAAGSTFSYARRYLTCLIFNVSTGDDDDGQGAGKNWLDTIAAHNDAVRNWFETIYVIKISIRDKEWDRGVEAFLELDKDALFDLRVAPTKGGIFTTDEIKAMKSDDWFEAKKARFGGAENDDS